MRKKEQAETLSKFVGDQLSTWKLACDNFRALRQVCYKSMSVGGLDIKAQFNPARIVSSAAKTDVRSLESRPCFLCRQNRPGEQSFLPYEGRKAKKYDILVNPYPIFRNHLVIAFSEHSRQSIASRYVDILDLAKTYQGYTFFYNGPKCGASAPDHHHFQAAPYGSLPLENDVNSYLDSIPRDNRGNYIFDNGTEGRGTWTDTLKYLCSVQDAHLYHYDKFLRGIFVIRSRSVKSSARLFYRLLDCVPLADKSETEPRFNLYSYFRKGEYCTIIVLRKCHRSHHYFSDGEDHLTMSPGCVDMAGLLIVPLEDDFKKLDSALAAQLLDEVCVDSDIQKSVIKKLTCSQTMVQVGIMSAETIEFELIHDGAGRQYASFREGKVNYGGALYDELVFDAQTPSTLFAEPSFILYGVTIGVGFHWERTQDQKFAGSLKIIPSEGKLIAINVIGVEDYLVSVISSEMRPDASEEFLKAHAVISRSWVLAQTQRNSRKSDTVPDWARSNSDISLWLDSLNKAEMENGEIVRWYDHTDHRLFDVCADDHCQRYQGLSASIGEKARKVIDSTWGEILVYGGRICDTRFSKCCGGTMEQYSSCWEDKDFPYLRPLPDTPGHDPQEKPFCDCENSLILSQVLNDYDLETKDFYRWEQQYDIDELSGIISSRSGRNIGRLVSIKALRRGPSGRIVRLGIEGDKGSFVVGKELEIRKYLSRTHLKSSAFDVKMSRTSVILRGKGWGHGVGLCQIGAAVMASKGYDYRSILEHYYPGAEILGNLQ